MIEIDGSYGEGGGQILRTALAMSMVKDTEIKIYNIRANRPKPGLSHQHLKSIEAAVEISNGSAKGLKKGQKSVEFKPGDIKGGFYRFDIGTAGSVTLKLQALLPPAVISGKDLTIELKGGTDVKWSPPYDYFEKVFLKHLENMNCDINSKLIKRGHYPKGGETIKIYKYNDTNLNGSYDDGEEMLSDWTFELYNYDDELVGTNNTNEDGYTMFHCLEPGNHYVKEITQSNWCNTTDIEQHVIVEDGETSELWFGNAECGTVYGYKFFDFNMNGEYDCEDEALEGWTIRLAPVYSSTSNQVVQFRETTTNVNGYYEFEMLCGEDMQFDFGNYRPSDIWGMKYCDVDRDGEFDTGLDKPLEGWEIQLWSSNETGAKIDLLNTTYTDNCGLYHFEDLLPGYYLVEEIVQLCGWENVTPTEVMVKLNYEDVRIDFANWRLGEITVFKYYDSNMNGVYDDGIDWPLVDWQINLWSLDENGSLDEIIDTGYTCDEGYYIFPDLEPGHYAVEDVLPEGWYSTTDPIQYVTVRCCCVWVEFGNYEEENDLELSSTTTTLTTMNYDLLQDEVLCAPIYKIN